MRVANPKRAQELMDDFLAQRWPKILDDFAIAANPMFDVLIALSPIPI